MGKILTLIVMASLLEWGVPAVVWAEAASNDAAEVAAEIQADASDKGGILGDAEQQAVGCAAVAGLGLAATVVAGPSEIIMLWGGGMLVPSHAAAVWLTLFTQIGVSGCALGAIATPTVLWVVDQSDNIAAKIAQSLSWTSAGAAPAVR